MELRQLRYFVAVAEERHFGRAANRLHIAGPSLSQQIRALERDLHTVLFVRSRREVELTASGQVLLEHAQILLNRAERARNEVQCAEQNGRERVTIRMATGAQYVLGQALRDLADRVPQLEVSAAIGFDSDVLQAVRDERVDAGIVWVGPLDGGLAETTLRLVPLQLAMPTGHRLAAHTEVPVGELAGETLVLFPRCLAPGGWDWLVRHLLPTDTARPAQMLLQLHLINTGPETMLQAVAAGRGVAPALPAALHAVPGVVLRPLLPALQVPLTLVWRDPPRPGLRRLATLLAAPEV